MRTACTASAKLSPRHGPAAHRCHRCHRLNWKSLETRRRIICRRRLSPRRPVTELLWNASLPISDRLCRKRCPRNIAINKARPDAVLVVLDHRGLPFGALPGDVDAEERFVADALEFVDTIVSSIRRNCNAVSIVQTAPRPVEGLFGSFDAVLPGTRAA